MSADDERHALLGPYLLHALDPAEAAAFEAHLERCATCREEVAALRPSVASLAALDESRPVPPPPGLRERLLAIAATTPQDPSSPGPTRARRSAPRRRRALAWAAGVAAAVLIGGGVFVALRPDEPATMTAAQVLAADDVRLHDMPTKMGRVRVGMSHEMHMVAVDGTHLSDPGAGMTYQVWWDAPDGPRSAGMLEDASSVAVPMGEGDLEITMEPAGGSPAPTSAPLLSMPADDL